MPAFSASSPHPSPRRALWSFLPLVLALCIPTLPAEEKAPANPANPTTAADWIVHIEFTAALVPEKLALPLIDEFDNEATADAAYAKLLAAVEKGEAELAGRQILKTDSGQERKAVTGEELKYPIEWEMPFYPNLHDKKDVTALPKEDQLALFGPVTFEGKFIGLSLTASASVSDDGQRIGLTATPEHTRFLGWKQFVAGITPQQTKITLEQPKFFTASNGGRVVVRSGQRVVFGVHKLPDLPRTWELFLLKVSTTRRPMPVAPEAK